MPYLGYFADQGRITPLGSRTGVKEFNGMVCPYTIDMGFVHGTSPATATVKFDEIDNVNVPIGAGANLQIGSNSFVGVVVNRTVTNKNDGLDAGTTINYGIVDMRDKLHDLCIFGAFNMMDQEGRLFHILPKDWNLGRRTYISEIQKTEFEKIVEQKAADFEKFACTSLVSAATLLNLLSRDFNFTWSASTRALIALRGTKPDNIDFTSGVSIANAIQQILDKCNCQFTVFGNLHLHITIPGVSENKIQRELLSDPQSLCNLGFTEKDVGSELNTKGRRVIVIGGANKYQFLYEAFPDWNLNFTFRICFNDFELSALLIKNNITSRLSKLKDLPVKYHDPENWNGQPRNEMPIKDYINEICFKCFVVDFDWALNKGAALGNLRAAVEHKDIQFKKTNPQFVKVKDENGRICFNIKKQFEEGKDNGLELRRFAHGLNPFTTDFDSIYPISDKLISHSDRQLIAYVNNNKVPRKGADNPFEVDESIVPVTSGSSLDVEEIMNYDTCKTEWKARVIFSEPRLKIEGNIKDLAIDNIDIPSVFVELATDRELFIDKGGEVGNSTRVREKKVKIPHLKNNWVLFNEVALLAGNLNTRTTVINDTETIDRGIFYLMTPDDFHGGDVPDNEWFFYLQERRRYEALLEKYLKQSGILIEEKRETIKEFTQNIIELVSVVIKKVFPVGNEKRTVINAVKAREISPSIVRNLLHHNIFDVTGKIDFWCMAGFVPDGMINSVQDSFDNESIRETINFSNDFNIQRFIPVVPLQVKEKEIIDEEKLFRIAMEQLGFLKMREGGSNAQSEQNEFQASLKIGGERNTMLARSRVFGDEESVEVEVNTSLLDNQEYQPTELMLFGLA